MEQEDGDCVFLADEQIKASYPMATQTIDIEAFVAAAEIPFLLSTCCRRPRRRRASAPDGARHFGRGGFTFGCTAARLPSRTCATVCASARATLRVSSCTLVSASNVSWLVAYGSK